MDADKRIIVIASGKGGVGKTSIAVNLAAEIATEGRRVLLADFDPQGTAALLFRLARTGGVARVLAGEPVEEHLVKVGPEHWRVRDTGGALWLLPGNNDTAAAAITLYLMGRPLTIIASLLHPLVDGGAFDFIILDTPPSVHPLAPYVYYAADWAVVPTDCGIEGIAGLAQTETNILNAPGRTEIIAIVPDRIPHNTLLHDRMIASLHRDYGDLVSPPLMQYDAWAKAAFLGQTMAVCARRTRAYSEWRFVYRNIVRALRGRGVEVGHDND